MILATPSMLLNPQQPLEPQTNRLNSIIRDLFSAVNGRIRFGVGTDGKRGENIDGRWQLFTTSGTPDAENTIAHGMGSTPIGFLIAHQDKAGSLYQGPTTGTNWDATSLFLKCDIASVTFLIFVLK